MGIFSWFGGSKKAAEPVVRKVYPGPPKDVILSQNSNNIIMQLAGIERNRFVYSGSDQGLLDKLYVKIDDKLWDGAFALSLFGVDLEKYAKERGVDESKAYISLIEEYKAVKPEAADKFQLLISNARHHRKWLFEKFLEIKHVLSQMQSGGLYRAFQNKLWLVMSDFVFVAGMLREDENFGGIYKELESDFDAVSAKLIELEQSIGRDEDDMIKKDIAEYGELAMNNADFQVWNKYRVNVDNKGRSLYQSVLEGFKNRNDY